MAETDPLQFTTSGGSSGAPPVAPADAPAQGDDPLLHVSNRSRSGMPAPYPDMTPGPPAKPILTTSFHTLPSDTRSGVAWDQPPDLAGAPARISTEMNQTYQNTPDLLTPEARKAVGNFGWPGRYVLGPLADVGSFAVKEGSALGAGGLAAASELLGGGNPQLTRDIHAGLQVLPVAQANAPPFTGPIVPREPSYTGTLTPKDLTPPGSSGSPPVGPAGPLYAPETLPTKTPADVLKIYQGQRAAADASNVTLTPKFTTDFVSSLDKYSPQSPTAQATAPVEHPVAALISDLRKSANAPFTDLRSLEEVDGQIQDAISGQYGSNGLSPAGVQMRQILRDFRDQYQNPTPDQISGSPQGLAEAANARNTYAAYSRMRELQGVVDSTEGNPNRATLIASRVNGFLNDDANVRGWTPEEIASARQAANSGFMQEWMRAEGSRLVGIGAAVALPGVGKLLGVPAQVGLSYAVRNAAENARIAQVQKALAALGQRVQQPGTVPPQPAPLMPSQTVVSGARYAPTAGLLGNTQDQDRRGTIFPPAW